MKPHAQKDWIFERLKHSVQALALPCEQQLRLFPSFVAITDELVLDFDHWQSCAIGNYQMGMTESQLRCLEFMNEKIESTRGSVDQTIWPEDALCSHVFWSDLRGLALETLEVFGWQLFGPPSYRHSFNLGGFIDN